MKRNQYLFKEQCESMFVDDTIIMKKRMMIICGKYLVVIPLLNIDKKREHEDNENNDDSFGSVYPLREYHRIYRVKFVAQNLYIHMQYRHYLYLKD